MKTIPRIIVLAALACAATSAFAAGGYLYSLNAYGNLCVNGNQVNTYASNFDTTHPAQSGAQTWFGLAIAGQDQYALRGDGLFLLNGVKQWKLPYNNSWWTKIAVSLGDVYALRQDGGLAVSNAVIQVLPAGDFYFTSLQVRGSTTYALRSDGSIFKDTDVTPFLVFHAGSGLSGQNDGKGADTIWVSLKLDPNNDLIYALRTDGTLYRASLLGGSNTIESAASLPFPTNESDFSLGDRYGDLDFDDVLPIWVVLRTDGQVYLQTNPTQPRDDFPGNGNTADAAYFDLAVFGGRYFALRGDGRVYAKDNDDYILKLPGNFYGVMELSALPPNLAGQKNIAPSVVQYTIPVNTNTPVRVPVIATDVESSTENLIVTPELVPTGAVWNAVARELTLIAPDIKGNYTFSYTVTDEGGSTKTYTSKIQVKYPDLDPSKNKPPYVPKLKGAMALAGREYRLYIPLGDPDGDPVTVTVDSASFPFSAGATYDSETSEFIWTPTNSQLGKYTVEFTLSDGTSTKKLKVKVEVKSPLYIAPLP